MYLFCSKKERIRIKLCNTVYSMLLFFKESEGNNTFLFAYISTKKHRRIHNLKDYQQRSECEANSGGG